MKPVRNIKPVHLPAGSVHRLDGAKGLQITAISGAVWVTQANDPRDIILTRGQSFILDQQGRTVVYALREAADVVVGPAGHITAAAFATPPAWGSAA